LTKRKNSIIFDLELKLDKDYLEKALEMSVAELIEYIKMLPLIYKRQRNVLKGVLQAKLNTTETLNLFSC
jgi:hypothetical protein